MTQTAPNVAPPRAAMPPLGEELPIFCEACGYSLHGLPNIRCDKCEVLHFHCPECGHHQPINTLRPAVQRMLGRMRAYLLAMNVFFRLNFFGWLLFAWFVMGAESSYQLSGPYYRIRGLVPEVILAFILFGLPFGLVSRMLLLRWRRGYFIALILATLTTLAVYFGMRFWLWERQYREPWDWETRHVVLEVTFFSVAVGVLVAWPAWVAVVRLFLPARTATLLLDWQRSLSEPTALAR